MPCRRDGCDDGDVDVCRDVGVLGVVTYGQHSFNFWGAAIQALLASPYVRYSPEGYLRDRYFEALMWGSK